ncbi:MULTISPECIES: alpha/beta fold hydrolase [Cytobacillus]|uniref:alpha/beta fold hydrolase n=1 Tax=Cytobacillus TaxID=2675230 RepID=UPI00203A9571|nr:alpha/beta hydrolase [Cytobacillus firmus]MCM3706926.1 alpha/beta hydrolase [Cytobacillus firmus]
MKKRKKIILSGIVVFVLFMVGGYFYKNSTYMEKPLKKMYRAGFIEKQAELKDGTVLNYGEGPSNGKTPLLLIHGQGMSWEDYAKVLPELSKHYHVFAVDCHGHGESERNPEKYMAKEMAEDFTEFIEAVIGEKTVVSGHSSGGMIAAWMAAYSPDKVLGIVIEDSPFFSTEPGRRENTYVWVYGFQLYEYFKNQDEEKDYFKYSLEKSYWKNMFGDLLWNKFSKDAVAYHEKHPNEPVHIKYLPPQINRIFESATYQYDRQFGEAFYDNSWFQDYNQSEVLSKIDSPAVFIKADTSYDGDLLVAALSDEDADRAVGLLKNGKRIDVDSPGHDIHYDKPEEFIEVMVDFLQDIRS